MSLTKFNNLTGQPVRCGGMIYVIEGENYYGMLTIVRFDAARRVWQRSSADKSPDASTPPGWGWEPVAPSWKPRLGRAIRNAERLHPHLEYRSKNARLWRRARAWRGVLRRFFTLCQAPERKRKP